MTAAIVLARPAKGRQRAGQPNTRGPASVGQRRTPGRRVMRLDADASVQFTEPIWFLVVRHTPAATIDGWVWVEGYQVDPFGEAVAQRTVLVREDAVMAALARVRGEKV